MEVALNTRRAPPSYLFKAMVKLSIATVLLLIATILTGKLGLSVYIQREEAPRDIPRIASQVDMDERFEFTPPNCTARTKLALAKTHKTGGTTLMQILHRFAYVRNLSLVLPRVTHPGRMNLFYLQGLTPETYLPPQTDHHDMLTYHTKYDREAYSRLLGNDAVFITILREPLSHLKSQFYFYELAKKLKISGPQPLVQFLENPGKYDHGRPSNLRTRSPMSVDLGISPDILEDITEHMEKLEPGQPLTTAVKTTIATFLAKMTKEMDLVMIMEYYDESLVMLKRLMCWELSDMLYFKMLSYAHDTKEESIPPKLEENHRQWDIVDYHLYQHFNKTFWRKVNELGDDFKEETAHFKNIHYLVQKHCTVDSPNNLGVLVIEESKWNTRFTVTHEVCTRMKYGQLCYMSLLQDRNIRYRTVKKRISRSRAKYVGYHSLHCALCEKFSNDCSLCKRISQDCTLNEYITHLFFENQLSHFDTSHSRNRHTVNGQEQEEFHVEDTDTLQR